MSDIYLVPLDVADTELIKKIHSGLSGYLNSNIKITELKLDYKKTYSTERSQYYSTELISEVIPLTDHLNGKVLLIVGFDIYIPIFTYVFGEAQLNGKHSIVSLCRLHEEFYTGRTDESLLYERAIKEILHELGHNFGLHHCLNWDCVMHSSTSVEEVDIKGTRYCNDCRKAINPILFK